MHGSPRGRHHEALDEGGLRGVERERGGVWKSDGASASPHGGRRGPRRRDELRRGRRGDRGHGTVSLGGGRGRGCWSEARVVRAGGPGAEGEARTAHGPG